MGALHPKHHHHEDGLHVDPRTGQAGMPPPPPVTFKLAQAFPGKNPNTFLDLAKMALNIVVNLFPIIVVALNTYTLGSEINGRDFYVKWRDIEKSAFGYDAFKSFNDYVGLIGEYGPYCAGSAIYDDRYWNSDHDLEAYMLKHKMMGTPAYGSSAVSGCTAELGETVDTTIYSTMGSYWDAASVECQDPNAAADRWENDSAPLIAAVVVIVLGIFFFVMTETHFWNHQFGSYGYISALAKVKKHPAYRFLILFLCFISVLIVLVGFCTTESFTNSPLALAIGLVNICLGCEEQLTVTAANLRPTAAAQVVHIGAFKAWQSAYRMNEVIEDGLLVFLATGNFEVLRSDCGVATLDDCKKLATATSDGKAADPSIWHYIQDLNHPHDEAPKEHPRPPRKEFHPEHHVHHQQNAVGCIARLLTKIVSYSWAQKSYLVAMFNTFVLVWNLNVLQNTQSYTFPDATLYPQGSQVPDVLDSDSNPNTINMKFVQEHVGLLVIEEHLITRFTLVNCRKSGFIVGTFLGREFGGFEGVESAGMAIMLFLFGLFGAVFVAVFFLSDAHRHSFGTVGYILGQADAPKSRIFKALIKVLEIFMILCGVYGAFFARENQCNAFYQKEGTCEPTDYRSVGLIAMSVLNMVSFIHGCETRVKTRLAHSPEVEKIWIHNMMITDGPMSVHGVLMDGILMKIAVDDDTILVDTLGIAPGDVDKLVQALIESELHLEAYRGQYVLAHPNTSVRGFLKENIANSDDQHNKHYTTFKANGLVHATKCTSSRKLDEDAAKGVKASAVVALVGPKDAQL